MERVRPIAFALAAAMAWPASAQLSPIAPIPPPSAFERELSEERAMVKRVVVNGVRSISEEELRRVAREFEGRALGEGDLRELERRLTQLYLDRGFATSGVVLSKRPAPPEGEAVYTAVEGTVAQVRFSSPPRYASPGWLTSLLVPRSDAPLRIAELQERMAAMRESGVVERINADVLPLPERGASELVVAVEERRPWGVELRYDNHHSPVVGARRPSLWVEHRNVTGWGDRFDAHVGRTDGLEDFHVAYSAAWPRSAWRLGARFERSDSLAIDPPAFRDLAITTNSETRRVELANALVATASRSISVTAAFERRYSDSTLLGIPFSFIAGLPDGITEIDVGRLSAEASGIGPDAVVFARVQWSEGKSRRPVEAIESAPAARFRAFAAQAQYARRVSQDGAQVLLRMDAQYSPDSLLPIEKKSVGGAESVRGYRENVLLRDSAIVATLEGRLPVWRQGEATRIAVAAFVDAAYARDTASRLEETVRSIASVGVSLIASLPWGFSGRIDYARPNRRWLTENSDSQDRGLHFRISWSP